MSDEAPDTAYDRARDEWGFPRFARSFPRDAELDALVVAFTRGDYARVREGARELVTRTDDPKVERAARALLSGLDADPVAKLLFAATAALLAFLTAWWIAHDGPGPERSAPRPTAPAAEHAK